MAEDNSLKILIQLGIIGQEDAKAVKSLLDETADSGNDLAKQMGVVNVTQEEVNKALGKGAEKAELTHGVMKKLAHMLGSEIPGGAALMEAGMTAAVEPMMSSTFLLLAGFEMLSTALEKMKKEEEDAKQVSEAMADLDGQRTKTIENQRDAMEEANVAQAVYLHNLVRNTEDAIARSSELVMTLVKARVAANENQENTRHDIAGKAVDDMEQRGVISHATALKMKEQLDIQYEQARLIRMKAQNAVELIEMERLRANREIEGRKLAKDEQTAEANYRTADKAKVDNDTKLKEAEDKIKAAQDIQKGLREKGVTEENIQKLEESYRKTSGDESGTKSLSEMFTYLSRHFGGIVPRDLFGKNGDVLLANYTGAQIDIESGKKDAARYRARQTDLDINEGTAKSDLEEARRLQQKNRDEVRALQDKITDTKATNAVSEGSAAIDLGMRQANNDLMGDRGVADRVMTGGAVSAADQQKLIADASRIAGHQVDLKTAAIIIENGANNIGIFMNQVQALSTVLSKFTPAQQADLQRQIDLLKAQVAASHEGYR